MDAACVDGRPARFVYRDEFRLAFNGYSAKSYFICRSVDRSWLTMDAAETETRLTMKFLYVLVSDVKDIFYEQTDRKSTRLNSSHQISSYAVFCWKKKNGGAINGGAEVTLKKRRERAGGVGAQ